MGGFGGVFGGTWGGGGGASPATPSQGGTGDVKGIFGRISALVGDPLGNWCTPLNYLAQFKQAWDWLFNKLRQTDMPFDEAIITIPGVPAGTRDLTAYQGAKQPLEMLIDPTKLWWKQKGTDDTKYTEVPKLDYLPDVQNIQGLQGFAWRLGTIFVTPSTIDMDLRLEGEFMFPEFVTPDDPIRMTGFMHILAFKTASLIGIEKGNDNWYKNYGSEAQSNLDDITAKFVKSDQAKVRRIGRTTRRGRSRRRLHLSN